MRLWSAALAVVLAVVGPAFAAPPAPYDNPVLRTVWGRYEFTDHRSGLQIGSEDFKLFVYADGRRMMTSVRRDYARNGQLTSMLQVDERFRPLEAYVAYSAAGGIAASALYRVEADRLIGPVQGADGSIAQTTALAPPASLVVHPISTDAWNTWYVDDARAGAQGGQTVDIIMPKAKGEPVVARLETVEWRFVGAETIKVKAGRFQVRHIRNAAADLWIAGPDRLIVRLSVLSVETDFELVALNSR